MIMIVDVSSKFNNNDDFKESNIAATLLKFKKEKLQKGIHMLF